MDSFSAGTDDGTVLVIGMNFFFHGFFSFNEPPLLRFAFAKAKQNGGGELIPSSLQENLAQIFEAFSCGDFRYITTP
jgi:hypothetical protein